MKYQYVDIWEYHIKRICEQLICLWLFRLVQKYVDIYIFLFSNPWIRPFVPIFAAFVRCDESVLSRTMCMNLKVNVFLCIWFTLCTSQIWPRAGFWQNVFNGFNLWCFCAGQCHRSRMPRGYLICISIVAEHSVYSSVAITQCDSR